MNLRIRLTLLSSVILSIACVALTLAVNFSADRAILMLTPISPPVSIPTEGIAASVLTPATQYELFRSESILAMLLVVLVGSIATYFIAGYTLKPLKTLTAEIKNKNINTLDEKITLPAIKDEVFAISLAFNELSCNLQKSFTLQEQFSGDVSHELRTPLAVMMAKLEVFKLSNQTQSVGALTMIDEMIAQLDKLSTLTNDLLWFSKDLPLQYNAEVDLQLLFSDLTCELSKEAKAKQISIHLAEKSLITHGDDALLERVFFNLLENAIKYSPEHANIWVELRKTGDRSIVRIIDTGEGISDAEKSLVFQPFYRIDGASRRLIGGNGLGLAICKKILDRHLATIEIKDNTPFGSIFEVSFPS